MTFPKTVFDLREFTDYLPSGDYGPAIRAMAAEASLCNSTSYGPVAEIKIPIGLTTNIDTPVHFAGKSLKIDFRSPIMYHGNNVAMTWNAFQAPVGGSDFWDIYIECCRKVGPGAVGGFPTGIDYNGVVGAIIRNMTNSKFRCQFQGFSYAGLELDGRGLSYGQPDGGGQVIQHCRFDLGQSANNGYAVRALSRDAATSSVQGNRIEGINLLQNHIGYSDGDPNFRASCSNTLMMDSADNATAIVFDIWGSRNTIFTGFTGAPGTSVLWRQGSYKNLIVSGNGPSDAFVVNDQSGPNSGNRVICPN